VPQIEVKFDIDQNGILNVSARDVGTGKEASVRIEQSSGLSKDEIESMKDDAKKHAAEDKKRREEVDTRNEADSRVHQSRKQLDELKDQIRDEDKKTIEEKIEALEKALKDGTIDEIKSSNEDLTKTWSDVSTRIYQQQGGEAGAEQPGDDAGAEGSSDEPDVETADYEVVDEDDDKK
jgi:molecular chaperone DnaK